MIETLKILGKIEDKANYRIKLKWTVQVLIGKLGGILGDSQLASV